MALGHEWVFIFVGLEVGAGQYEKQRARARREGQMRNADQAGCVMGPFGRGVVMVMFSTSISAPTGALRNPDLISHQFFAGGFMNSIAGPPFGFPLLSHWTRVSRSLTKK